MFQTSLFKDEDNEIRVCTFVTV